MIKLKDRGKRKTKHEKFFRYAKSLFLKSYIQSVSNIVGAKSWRVKILEFLMFALCLGGMGYNISSYIELYRSYSTVKNEIITKPQYLEQPAITFCNLNRIPRKLACEFGEIDCEPINKTDFCKQRFHSCPDKGEPYLKVKSNKEIDYMTTDEFSWDLLWQQENPCSIIACSISVRNVTTPCEKPSIVPMVNVQAHPILCCTVSSAWGDPKNALKHIDRKATIKIMLNTNPEDYVSGSEHPSIYVSIHNRKTFVNPIVDKGFQLKGGRKYLARVSKMTEIQSLPPPYDTKCRNYTKAWFQSNGISPITQQDCQEECKVKFYTEKVHCVKEIILYSHMMPICRKVSVENYLNRISTRECHNSCGVPCLARTYGVTYFDEGVFACDGSGSNDHSEYCLNSNISFTVSFSFLRLKKITYAPQFEDIEFFSNIGGFMGMWIGIALVDITDFLLSIGNLIIYPWTQKRRIRAAKSLTVKQHNMLRHPEYM